MREKWKTDNPGTGPVWEFAHELQLLRRRAALTYDAMAARSPFAKSTLATADNGKRLPRWAVVQAYVEACGGDVEYARSRWIDTSQLCGRRADTRPEVPVRQPATLPQPDPTVANDPAEYRILLRQLRAWAGNPTYRELSLRAQQRNLRLRRSTLCDMLSGRRRVRETFLINFLTVCGLTDEDVRLWAKVRAGLEGESSDPEPAARPSATPVHIEDHRGSEPPDQATGRRQPDRAADRGRPPVRPVLLVVAVFLLITIAYLLVR